MSDWHRRWISRAIVLLGLLLAGYYATLGGEYSVFDVGELRRRTSLLGTRVDSLRAVVDSLERWSERLTEDPAAIERVARERYGFLRDGERLYRFVTVAEEAEEPKGGRPEGP